MESTQHFYDRGLKKVLKEFLLAPTPPFISSWIWFHFMSIQRIEICHNKVTAAGSDGIRQGEPSPRSRSSSMGTPTYYQLQHLAKLFDYVLLLLRLAFHIMSPPNNTRELYAFPWYRPRVIPGLLKKLLPITLPSALVRLMTSFLNGWSFYDFVKGSNSLLRSICAGVPQGFPLSYTPSTPMTSPHSLTTSGRGKWRAVVAVRQQKPVQRSYSGRPRCVE